jgi:hypothetical protein
MIAQSCCRSCWGRINSELPLPSQLIQNQRASTSLTKGVVTKQHTPQDVRADDKSYKKALLPSSMPLRMSERVMRPTTLPSSHTGRRLYCRAQKKQTKTIRIGPVGAEDTCTASRIQAQGDACPGQHQTQIPGFMHDEVLVFGRSPAPDTAERTRECIRQGDCTAA